MRTLTARTKSLQFVFEERGQILGFKGTPAQLREEVAQLTTADREVTKSYLLIGKCRLAQGDLLLDDATFPFESLPAIASTLDRLIAGERIPVLVCGPVVK